MPVFLSDRIPRRGGATTGLATRPPRYAVTLALLVAAAGVVQAAAWPVSLWYRNFAFGDYGANLTLYRAMQEGLRPGVDFGYTYGPLVPALTRAWFGLWGATPISYQAAMIVLHLALAALFAAFATAARLSRPGVAFLVLGFVFTIQPTYISFAHPLEAAFIVAAAVAHLRRRYAWVLSLLAVAVLCRMSLAAVYGVVVVGILVMRWRAGTLPARDLVRTLIAPAVVTLLLMGVSAVMLGASSLAAITLPFAAARHYALTGRGPAHSLQHFLAFAYHGNETVGIYLAGRGVMLAGLALVWGVGVTASRRAEEAHAPATREVLAAVGVLLAAWIALMFGYPWDWWQYAYLVVLGAALVPTAAPRWGHWAVAGLSLLLLNQVRMSAAQYRDGWTERHSSPARARLWFTAEDERALQSLTDLHLSGRVEHLTLTGAFALLPGGFGSPPAFMLLPGMALPAEVAETAARIDRADFVVVSKLDWRPAGEGGEPAVSTWQEIAAAVAHKARIAENDYFTVWAR